MAARAFAKQTLPLVVGGEVIGVVGALAQKPKDDETGKNAGLERLRIALERLGRSGGLYAGLHALTRNDKSFPWVTSTAGVLFALTRPFSWNLSLFMFLRAFTKVLRKKNVALHMNPLAIFLIHCVHNNFLLHKAEQVDPSYLRMWLKVIPGYPTLDLWLSHFRSTKQSRYAAAQVGLERIRRIPANLLESMRRQAVLVSALYIIPSLVFHRRTAKLHFQTLHSTLCFLRSECLRITRTTIVLSSLPYVLTEFPCIYDYICRSLGLIEKDSLPVQKAPILHVTITSVFSTAVFLTEREARLNHMIAYTYWRVIEAWLRPWFAKSKQTTSQEEGNYLSSKKQELVLASLLTGLAAALANVSSSTKLGN